MVPAANLTGRDPVEPTALQRLAIEVALGSDAAFWALARLAPGTTTRALLATDPALLDRVDPTERRRAEAMLTRIMPIARKTDGLRNDAFWAGAPTRMAWERIAVPTLILSAEDDLFSTADTARLLAERIPSAALTIHPSGGHLMLGHDEDAADAIAAFVREHHPCDGA